jgi:hypothetical protein
MIDLSPATSFAAATCVSANSMVAAGGFPAATCNAYCAGIGKTCSDTCATNHGSGPTYGLEAWTDAPTCASYASSLGQGFCDEDLSGFSNPDVAKYRCCCR